MSFEFVLVMLINIQKQNQDLVISHDYLVAKEEFSDVVLVLVALLEIMVLLCFNIRISMTITLRNKGVVDDAGS